jgi:hypothetical protein
MYHRRMNSGKRSLTWDCFVFSAKGEDCRGRPAASGLSPRRRDTSSLRVQSRSIQEERTPRIHRPAGSLKCVRNSGGCGTRQFLWYKNSDSNSPRPFPAISNTFQATPTGAQGKNQDGSASHSMLFYFDFYLAVDLTVPWESLSGGVILGVNWPWTAN